MNTTASINARLRHIEAKLPREQPCKPLPPEVAAKMTAIIESYLADHPELVAKHGLDNGWPSGEGRCAEVLADFDTAILEAITECVEPPAVERKLP
jgi:hypothetical protein